VKFREIQDWIWAGTTAGGVTVAADHQLVRLEDGLLRAQMLRGLRFTSARVVRGDAVTVMDYPVPGPGHYVFKYSLSSHPDSWKSSRSYRAGMAFNNPLVAVNSLDEIAKKSLPPSRSFLSVSADNLVLSAVKKAERDDAIVLRFFEIEGAAVHAPILWLGQTPGFTEVDLLEDAAGSGERRALSMKAYEIKTIRLGN
jgi:alpha-mannosidase